MNIERLQLKGMLAESKKRFHHLDTEASALVILIRSLLKEAAKQGKPLRFIKGNGEYIGAFVIAEISKEIVQTSNEGDLTAVQLEVKLQEYAGKIPDETAAKKGFKKRK